jgi:hypothetical protein
LSQKPKLTAKNFIVGIVSILLLAALGIFLSSWIVMLFIGNASIASGGAIPALSYETVVWLVLALTLLLLRTARR